MCATPPPIPPPTQKRGRKYNSYLEEQIRGGKDKKWQIWAGVHPCSQWEPGYCPVTGAALTGSCGKTNREAAGALTAGGVVTHRFSV